MSKKIRSFVIILGVLVVVVGLCAGLGYYYILAPNTSVKDDGIIYLRDNSSISQVLDTLRKRIHPQRGCQAKTICFTREIRKV